MQDLTFGIEIETIGASRAALAVAVAGIVGGTVAHVAAPTCYDPYHVTAADGRIWKLVADASLSAPSSNHAEVVSPILRLADLETLQQVVRAIRAAGAKVDESCGIHIHVGASAFDAAALCRLVKQVNKNEELLFAALGVTDRRKDSYCRPLDQNFLARLEAQRPRDLNALNVLWYGRSNPRPNHYDSTRYRALNLHALWNHGTVEFRLFEATLHAGKVKAYVQLALAICAKALRSRTAQSARRAFNPATAKYDFRVYLLSLGMIGDEFKTARLHLLSRLEGSAAWKHGRPVAAAAEAGSV